LFYLFTLGLKMKVFSACSLVVAGATLPTKEIAPGVNLPVVNIGTWLAGSSKEDPKLITKNWLDQGFRGIDTALVYNDQKNIAAVIAESGIPREDIFITSKLPGCGAAAASVNSDLKQLNVDYIDLMLIHSPIGLNCPGTWKVLEDFVAQGKLRAIGVSNFNPKQMQNIMKNAKIPIAVNQIVYNVFNHNEETIAFCDANNITVEAYSPLKGQNGAQSIFKDETVKGIAAAHNVSAAQVALKWIVQRGHTLAVLSSSAEHQANDADLWSFDLADDEMDTLTQHQKSASVAKFGAGKVPTKEIAPGVNLPVVNIGTWLAGSSKEDPKLITKNWLDQGFRGIDTALIYNDQKDIASVIAESGIPREEIFITSKLPGCGAAAASVNSDLKQLNVDYIDLMLIHSPIGLNCPGTWKVLEDFVAQGKLRAIGVSNFNAKQMQNIMKNAKIPIAVNQIEYNVFSHNEETIAFCDANNITVEAYSPLSGQNGAQSVFKDDTVKGIAAAHNVSAAQVALKWIVQRGHTLAVLSSSAEHQANDADLWSFDLADDEMDTLTQHQTAVVVV